jgi:hypothetical protein
MDEHETIDFELSRKDLIINWALVGTLVAGLILAAKVGM